MNATPLSPYVASVVASELGFDVAEAAKAQAVLARTYALRRLGTNPTYDLDDHQGSQVFRGLETITAMSQLAAEGTDGVVLTYAGNLVDATYFSSSGGHTADNETAWNGAPVPYLRGVPDPYDESSPHYSWQTRLPKTQVLEALTPLVGQGATGVVLEQRSRSGRVIRMRALGATRPLFTGAQFRRHVNAVAGWRTVQSTKFDLDLDGSQYVLRGGGFGHGVGMSQYGAMGQARLGRDYRDILTYYFTGAVVEGGRTLPGPLVTSAEPLEAPSEDDSEDLSLHSRYLLTDPRGRASRQQSRTGTHSPLGEPMQQTSPQSTDDRAGDRRSGTDRRSGVDRRGPERASAGRRASGRRQSEDRRQTVYEAPTTQDQSQRRAAW